MIIRNKLIPFKGFSAMAIYPFIFIRKDQMQEYYYTADWPHVSIWPSMRDRVMLNHEKIHLQQQKEMSLIGLAVAIVLSLVFGFNWWFLLIPLLPFYVLYALSWLLNFILLKDAKRAYRNICFEREAYLNGRHLNYLENRKPFSWFKYIGL